MQNVGSLTGPVLGGLVAEWWNIHAPFYVLSLGVMVCLLVSMKLPVMQHDQLTRQHNSTKSQWPKPLILLGIIHFFEFMGLGIWLAIWPIYAVENLGWTSSMVGASFSISALASLITAPIWGRISDQYGRTVSAILGLILLILQPLSVVVLADVPLLIWPLFALAGAGGTGYFNAYFTLVGDLSPAHDVGWFQGVLGSGSQLGNSAGSLLAPILWQALSIEFALLGDVTLLTMCMALFIPLFIRERNQQITKKG
jgi:MFS family permease